MPDIIARYEVGHMGWDISTKVILDSDGNIWMDNAHGSSDGFEGKENKGHYTKWLKSYQGMHDQEYFYLAYDLRKRFNLKPQVPDWVVTALQNGWTPPTSFNRDDYDWP